MKLNINLLLDEAIKAHQQGRLEEAENFYYKILKIYPKHPETNHNLGILFSSQDKLSEALELFKRATEENPSHEKFWLSFSNILIKKNKLDEAETACKKAIDINPNSVEAYNYLAITQEKFKRLDQAILSFKKAIQINPAISKIHFNLGVILYKINKFKEAEISLKKAVDLKPDFVEAFNNLGITLDKLGKLNEAEITIQKAIKLNPNYAEAYNNLGLILKKSDKLEEAEINFKKAIKLKPNYAEAYNNLGLIFNNINNIIEAEKYYKKAIELKPTFEDAFNNLGTSLYIDGRLEEAQIMYDNILSLNPHNDLALYNRGHIFAKTNKFKEALKDFDLSNSQDAKVRSLTCLYALGRIKEIYQRIDSEAELNIKNLNIAAFSSFISYKEKKSTSYDFCINPMDFIIFSNLSSHLNDSNLFIDELVKELENIKTRWEPLNRTTRNGYHSGNKNNLFKMPQEKMSKLKSIIENELDAYHLKFKDENCSFIRKWPTQKKLMSWYIILKKQGYQIPHIHPTGWLSGVIYLKVVPPLKKNEGAIEFSLNGEHYFDKNSPKLIHEPKAGEIVLFPSSLHHKTIPFTTDTDRIIVSFDLTP